MKNKDFEEMPDGIDTGAGNAKKLMSTRKRLAIGIAAVVLICALALVAPALPAVIGPPAENDAGAIPSDSDALTRLFSGTTSSLSIEMPVSRYTPLLSSVPGLPFRAICPDADEIRFSAGAGAFLLWGAPDYEVKQAGTSCAAASGDTVYWTPDADPNAPAGERLVTISALRNGQETGRAVIVIGNAGQEYTVQNISVTVAG